MSPAGLTSVTAGDGAEVPATTVVPPGVEAPVDTDVADAGAGPDCAATDPVEADTTAAVPVDVAGEQAARTTAAQTTTTVPDTGDRDMGSPEESK